MKKMQKPLRATLNRETLRQLDSHQIEQVAGGATFSCGVGTCLCSNSCGHPCTQ